MLQFIENFFLFKPTTAAKEWISPPEGYGIEELWLQASDGNKIHAWWIPPPAGKPKKAVLYCHGNGGNLSLRFEGVKRWLQLLDVGVLIFDYPGYGKSLGKPSEQSCYASSKASLDWLLQQGFKPSDLIFYGGSLGGTPLPSGSRDVQVSPRIVFGKSMQEFGRCNGATRSAADVAHIGKVALQGFGIFVV